MVKDEDGGVGRSATEFAHRQNGASMLLKTATKPFLQQFDNQSTRN